MTKDTQSHKIKKAVQAITPGKLVAIVVAVGIAGFVAVYGYSTWLAPMNNASTGGNGVGKEEESLLKPAATMQDFTARHCAQLHTYTGDNDDAIQTITDSRGGSTTQTYRVAKLVDGNCWMLDNLKLGSTSDTIRLTSADSDVANDFVLPQLATAIAPSYDSPQIYGTLPGDTGSDETNYGYLYNWSAATAGESRATLINGNASHSICPTGWKLPKGVSSNNDMDGDFAMLNAKMNDPNADKARFSQQGSGYSENWRYNGVFKGVYAGFWKADEHLVGATLQPEPIGSFNAQGVVGMLWTQSNPISTADFALAAQFSTGDSLLPGNSPIKRDTGVAIRCIASKAE